MSRKRTVIPIGSEFNYLTTISDTFSELSKGERKIVKVRCLCKLCGTEKNIQASDILNGKIKSCGCYSVQKAKENIGKYNDGQKHGLLHHPLYHAWRSMKIRCYNKKCKGYKGGEYTVCDEWVDNFKTFYNWATNNGWKRGLCLCLKDGCFIYSSENCCFKTYSQYMGKSDRIEKYQKTCLLKYGKTRFIKGGTKTQKSIQDWLEKLGLKC